MKYFFFIDESGDHGMSNIDAGFPVFVVCGVLISEENYIELDQKIKQFKIDIWGEKKVILHSSDIRKCDNEFMVLFDMTLKKKFYDGLNKIITEAKYTVFASVIEKEKYIKRYGKLANDVYEISFSFLMERVVFYLDDSLNIESVNVIVEKRGKREDNSLQNHFTRILSRGTGYVRSKRFIDYKMKIFFHSKSEDITGLQLSDLAAYPIARYVMDEARANPAYDIIKPKIYTKYSKLYGLKRFP